MPELRLVVLALQDRLAYGPTFESAMKSLFGGETSSLTAGVGSADLGHGASSAPIGAASTSAAQSTTATQPTDLNDLISGAARDLSDYQRLTAEGKLGEAGQKLEQLKRKLDELNARKK
jgi:uncharacterized membrane protein (UPF0182 family)